MVPAINVLTNFMGVSVPANLPNPLDPLSDGELQPPEPEVAVGPTSILQTSNFSFNAYDPNLVTFTPNIQLTDRDGMPITPITDLKTFFAPALPLPPLSLGLQSLSYVDLFVDPNATYDTLAERFVFICFENVYNPLDPTNEAGFYPPDSVLHIAVSKTSTPQSLTAADWTFTTTPNFIPATPTSDALFGDFPRLGFNADVWAVTINMTPMDDLEIGHLPSPTDGRGVQLTIIDKSDPTLNTTYITYPVPRPIGSPNENASLVPARMRDAKPGDPLWLVEEKDYGNVNLNNELYVVKATNLLSTTPVFEFNAVTVDSYVLPCDPPKALCLEAKQPGGNTIGANDTSMLSVDYRGGWLVAAHNVALGLNPSNPHQPNARWYEFNVSTGVPELFQQGTIVPGPGVSTYFPVIAIAGNGDIGMTYLQSSASERMSIYVTGRTASDPLGTMQPAKRVKRSEAPWTPTNPDYRAGDYSGINPDPLWANTFWVAGEYGRRRVRGEQNNWSTWVGAFTIQRITTAPDPDDSNLTALFVTGTANGDNIRVLPGPVANSFEVVLNGVSKGVFSGVTGQIMVNGYAGNDTIKVSTDIARSAYVDGGRGNDNLWGGSGDDILLGGRGNDHIYGRAGQDIIIGGLGKDDLWGYHGGVCLPAIDADILVGSDTKLTPAALWLALSQWVNQPPPLTALTGADVIVDFQNDRVHVHSALDLWFVEFTKELLYIKGNCN